MKIFVSRSSESWAAVAAQFDTKDFEWNCMSLIRTMPVEFQLPERSFDWVFFSSREAVNAFFTVHAPVPSKRIGAIGTATAEALRPYTEPDFVGHSSNTDEVAQTFARCVGESTVLFPISNIGIKTVQNALPVNQVIDMICYHTILENQSIAECDGYIFSSPSNVDAFFKSNMLPKSATVWAFGKRTAQNLKAHGCDQVMIFETLEAAAIGHTIKEFYFR